VKPQRKSVATKLKSLIRRNTPANSGKNDDYGGGDMSSRTRCPRVKNRALFATLDAASSDIDPGATRPVIILSDKPFGFIRKNFHPVCLLPSKSTLRQEVLNAKPPSAL